MKGVSIFYEYHEQGSQHVIAGIYSPRTKSEEVMRTELLSLLGSEGFHERDQPTYINHTYVYAHDLLDEEMDEKLKYTFSRFFPEALEPVTLPREGFKFYYVGEDAYNFIWDNRYRKELRNYRAELQKESSMRYMEERKEKKRLEREEQAKQSK